MKDIETRLYKCFENIFNEYNGKLRISLNNSNIIYDMAGYACSDEFLDEMYEKWLETHEDNIKGDK